MSICIAGKARADYKYKVEAEEIQRREHPVIQLDIMFGPGGNPVLLLIDTWTRYVFLLLLARTKVRRQLQMQSLCNSQSHLTKDEQQCNSNSTSSRSNIGELCAT